MKPLRDASGARLSPRRYLATLAMVASLGLAGCESGVLGALAGSALSLGATTTGAAFKEKLDARAKWRVERATFITGAEQMMETEAQTLFKTGKTAEAIAMYRELLAFHDENYPDLLVEKLTKYLAERQKEREAVARDPVVETVPQPQ